MDRYFSANAVLSWIAFLLLCSSFVSHCSESCSNEGNCQKEEEDYLYRLGTRSIGYEAVDVCFIVAATSTMSGSQRWIQIFVPLLEMHLKSLGVGNTSRTYNRYCLVQFGSRGRFLNARFLLVDGRIFFPESKFVMARRQLRRNGDVADGYEAINFTVAHAPFRNESHIAKHLIIATNMGRSSLALATSLTRESIQELLKSKNITLDAVVEADFNVRMNATNTVKAVGLNGNETATLIKPNGDFEFAHGEVIYDSNQGKTIYDYVILSLNSGGSSWSIEEFNNEDLHALNSSMKAFVASHGIVGRDTIAVCEKCTCLAIESSIDDCESLLCEVPADQEKCRCTVDNTPPECVKFINPTPVVPPVTSVLAPTAPTETPLPLAIDGSLSQFPFGEVELEFTSERSNAQYFCFLIDRHSDTPHTTSCFSPHYIKNLSSGHYQLLVFGKRKSFVGSRVFDFYVPPEEPEVPPRVTLLSLNDANNSVAVVIKTDGFVSNDLNILCSIQGADFFPCSSPHILRRDQIGTGVQFIAVATDSRGRAAVGMMRVVPPTPPPPTECYPPMITNITVQPPDLHGRILIHFNTSITCTNITCICRANNTNPLCMNEFQADPREIGAGLHDISISCMDKSGFVDTKNVKVQLQIPPRPPASPLSCTLDLTGPTEDSTLIAVYTCDRRVIANCQVSSQAPKSCSSPNGVYEVSVANLQPGPHLFILNIDDGYGKTLMKVVPFTIGTAHRKCCPTIVRNSTAMAVNNSLQVELDVSVTAGNCTDTEGFSYIINWGDGASETGTSTDLSPVHSSRSYTSQGDYVIEVSYCNNPAREENTCCDLLNLPVHLSQE